MTRTRTLAAQSATGRTPMNRRTATALLAPPILAAATCLAACDPATDNAATQPAAAGTTAADSPSCSADFGPGGTGINAFGGTITATVTLNCTGPYDTPDPLISLTLVRQPPGSATAATAAAKSWQSAELSYSVSADCQPGTVALHVLYGVTVGGRALADRQWGKQITLTAADCA